MKIAIIGVGAAGVVSLKHAIASGHECDAFEQTGELGGTWVYTDRYGIDEFGFPSHRTMYQGLITNLPKEVMEFLDYRYPSTVERSYITQPEVLQYLQNYATHFNLHKHIQYYKRITKVHPLNNQWTVTVLDVRTKMETSTVYDAVFVCNGHFFHPYIPPIKGQDLFKGLQIHSRDYRNPDKFKNKRVLVIGASYSGMDIARIILPTAKKLIVSHRSKHPNILDVATLKPCVAKFSESQAVFDDGTTEDIDIVLYCTGYEFHYPFLTDECGITVDNNWVKNLYKHVVNIEKPTLFFIGIPFLICAFPNCDVQAKLAVAVLDKSVILPSREDMMKDLNEYTSSMEKKNIPKRHYHKIGISLGEYFEELAQLSGVSVPPAVIKLYRYFIEEIPKRDVTKKYVLIDDQDFKEVQL